MKNIIKIYMDDWADVILTIYFDETIRKYSYDLVEYGVVSIEGLYNKTEIENLIDKYNLFC